MRATETIIGREGWPKPEEGWGGLGIEGHGGLRIEGVPSGVEGFGGLR